MTRQIQLLFCTVLALLCIIAAPAAALTTITPAELATGTYQCNIAGETYEITGDVIGPTGDPVIQVNADNVVVTSQTEMVTITAASDTQTFADATGVSAPTFSNMGVSGFSVGFHLLSATDASLDGCVIANCGDGFQIYNCMNFIASDTAITDSTGYAVNTSYLDWSATLTDVTIGEPSTPISFTTAWGYLIRDLGSIILPDPVACAWIGPDPDAGDKYVVGIDYNKKTGSTSGTLYFNYTDADIEGIAENSLKIYRYRADTGWEEVPNSVVDADMNSVSASISLASTADNGYWYAPFGGAKVIIDSFPYTITVPGDYYIGTDYTTTGSVALVTIEASDVTLDGMGHILQGTSQQGYGVNIHGTDTTTHQLENVVVKNLTLSDFYHDIRSEYTSNARITDMVLSGAGTAAHLSNFDHSTIDNVTIPDGDTGIEFTGAFGTMTTGATVKDCTLNNCLYSAIAEQGGYNSYILIENTTITGAGRSGIYLNGYRHTIDSCTITGPGEIGVKFDQPMGADYYGHIISNSIITNYNSPVSSSQYPLYIGADDVTVRNCRIADSQWGVLIGYGTALPDGTTLDRVTIENLTAPNLGSGVISGVKVAEKTDNTLITGCTIDTVQPVNSAVTAYGVYLYAQNAAYPVENVTVTNTSITNVKDAGIRAECTTGTTVTDTTITSVTDDQSFGLYATESESLTTDGCTIADVGYDGIYTTGCDHLAITDTTITIVSPGVGVNLQALGGVTVTGAALTNVSVSNTTSYGMIVNDHDGITITGADLRDIGGQYGIKFDDVTNVNATGVAFHSLPTTVSFAGGGDGYFGFAGADALPGTELPDGKEAIARGVMVQRSVPDIDLTLSVDYDAESLPPLTDEDSLRLYHHRISSGWVECSGDSYVDTTAEEVHADLSDTPTGSSTWFFVGPLLNETGLTLPYIITEPGTYALDQDFTGTYSNAITILSDDVILEGNGNSITTTIAGDTAGITVGEAAGTRYANVIVRNFTLSGFAAGVDSVNVDELTVSGVTATGAVDGFVLTDIENSYYIGCAADSPTDTGFTLGGDTNTIEITDCRVEQSGGIGIRGTETSDNGLTLTNVTVSGSGSTGISLAGQDLTIDQCRVEDTTYAGITIGQDSFGTMVRDSVVERTGTTGITISAPSAALSRVVINDTGGTGFYAAPGSAHITSLTLTDVTITNTTSNGIRLNGGTDVPTISGVRVTNATVTNTGWDAVYLTGCADPVLNGPVIDTTAADAAGIEVVSSTGAMISSPVVYHAPGGPCTIRNSENTVILNPTILNTGAGFLFRDSNRTALVSGMFIGNSTTAGVASIDSSDVTISEISFSGNETGIVISGGDGIQITDISMQGTDEVISTDVGAMNVTVSGCSISALNTTIDASFDRGLTIGRKTSLPPAPAGHALISHGVLLTRLVGCETNPVNLSIFYTAEDVAGLNEETLRLYSTDSADWEEIPGDGDVDTTSRSVWADFRVTTAGVTVAPLATTTATVTIPVELSAGWNMISVPVANATFEVPPAAGTIYRYGGSVYEEVGDITHVSPGEGVWISATAPCTLTMTGEPLTGYIHTSVAGWNMIGSASESMPFDGHITTDPTGVLGTILYTYDPTDGRYKEPTECTPGNGYWASTTQACDIILI